MFNLPFPTDSLYKFAFMFGIVLIIFSFYFRDTHLNRYSKTQPAFIIDSLIDLDTMQQNKGLKIFKFIKDVKDTQSKNNKQNIIGVVNFSMIFEELTRARIIDTAIKSNDIDKGFALILRDINSPNPRLTQNGIESFRIEDLLTDRLNELHKKHFKELAYYKNVMSTDSYSFYFLISIGLLLFILGTVFWYLKIQKPQDELLLEEIKKIRAERVSKIRESWKHEALVLKEEKGTGD